MIVVRWMNHLIPWNSSRMDGNPTKSLEVNGLVKQVKKKEVRKQGEDSSARKALTEKEYRMLQRIFKTQSPPTRPLDMIWKFGMPALLNYQYHLIARIDDTPQVTMDNIPVHDEFANCLLKNRA